MEGEFCVVCGRTDLPVMEGVCPECTAKRERLLWVEGHPSVTLCANCGARKIGQHWERRGASPTFLGAEDLAPLLSVHPEVGIRTTRWQERTGETNQRLYEGEVDVRFRGTERTVAVELPVRVKVQTCPECSRRTGRFFTAVIQLRGPNERLRGSPRAMKERLIAAFDGLYPEMKADWKRAFSWREELPEGWDFYILDTLAARSAARFAKTRLHATLTESATLWGRKNGKDVYRVTFCLRVPDSTGPP
jgi:nonsense-mediated mRNA decay protein 3